MTRSTRSKSRSQSRTTTESTACTTENDCNGARFDEVVSNEFPSGESDNSTNEHEPPETVDPTKEELALPSDGTTQEPENEFVDKVEEHESDTENLYAERLKMATKEFEEKPQECATPHEGDMYQTSSECEKDVAQDEGTVNDTEMLSTEDISENAITEERKETIMKEKTISGHEDEVDNQEQISILEQDAEENKVGDAASEKFESNGCEQEAEGEEIWKIVRAFTSQEQADHKIRKMCMRGKCRKVAVAEWANNLELDALFCCCESCQEARFGGWPEGFEIPDVNQEDDEEPTEKSEQINTSSEVEECDTNNDSLSNEQDAEIVENEEQVEEEEDDNTEQEGAEADWVIEKVFSVAELTKSRAQKCKTKGCGLLACVKWARESTKETWYTCVDCQELDFDGWPPEDETPPMSAENIDLISLRCSNQEKPKMPRPRVDSSPTQSSPKSNTSGAAHVTPPPDGCLAGGKKNGDIALGVTPSPAEGAEKNKKPSAKLTELHKKWQSEAEKVGGKGARVVCSKIDAKRLIRDVLYESFGPMSITAIYTALKATVPSVILRVCLDEMVFDDTSNGGFDNDSDDEGGTKKKKSGAALDASDPYVATVLVKEGRNMSSNLYYLDQTKLENGGEGLTFEHRAQLETDYVIASSEETDLSERLQKLTKEATQLLSEPTNEELDKQLEATEQSLTDLNDMLNHYRALKVNESTRKKILKGIEYYASIWRSRKRICHDFLINMEEVTDGAVRMKKCLSGDGQIELDGDEAILKAAVAYRKRKQQSSDKNVAKRIKPSENKNEQIDADEKIIGVQLDRGGIVRRVYIDDPNFA